jgi:hypothetical protein
MHDLPLIQGFAYCAWAVENNSFASAERIGPGYVGQEVARLQAGEAQA